MIHQYGAQRFYVDAGTRQHIGTIPTGTIVYIQDNVGPFRFPSRVVCREPWIVEAWIPRATVRYDGTLQTFTTVRCAGGHLAQVRSLRTGRRTEVADWILLACIDAGLEKLG
jgi:hypothetical protein